MSILDKIQEAQTKAAEKVVCDNLDKLNLNGAGGVTRRMTKDEEIADLKAQLAASIPISKVESLIDVNHKCLKILPETNLTLAEKNARDVINTVIHAMCKLLPNQQGKDNENN